MIGQKLVRYSGIFAILSVSILLAYAFRSLGKGTELRSVSSLGVIPHTQALFTLALTIGAVLSLIFFAGYVDKCFKTNPKFRGFYRIAIVSQIIVAWLPANPDEKAIDILHWTFSMVLGFALGGIMYQFAMNQSNNLPRDIKSTPILIVFFLIFAINMFAVIYLSSFAITQGLAVAMFWYWMIRATFLPPTRPISKL